MNSIEKHEQDLKYLRAQRRYVVNLEDFNSLEAAIMETENQLATLKAERDRLPPSRAHAKAMRKTFYFTGQPCPKGHVAKHRTSNYECMKCKKNGDMKRRRQAVQAKKGIVKC